MKNKFKIGIILFIMLLQSTVLIVQSVQLRQDCTGYLKRAADSNSIELALEQLNIAVAYLESSGKTSGYTSILYKTPDEDVTFWYHNLKTCQAELQRVTPETTALERSNILLKLRETLVDTSDGATIVTYPSGLVRHPHNTIYAIVNWLVLLITLGFFAKWIYDNIEF